MSYGAASPHTRGLATLNLANAAIFTFPSLRMQVKSLNCIDANEMKLRSKTSDQSDLIHLLFIPPRPHHLFSLSFPQPPPAFSETEGDIMRFFAY